MNTNPHNKQTRADNLHFSSSSSYSLKPFPLLAFFALPQFFHQSEPAKLANEEEEEE